MPNPELNQPALLNRLILLRESRGLTLNEAARRSKVSAAYLSKLERGEIKTPSPRKLKALSQGMGANYSMLMALAGYSLEVSPQEADPVRELGRVIGVEDLSFDAARFAFTILREMRLGKEQGIPVEVTGKLATTAIRAYAGDDKALDDVLAILNSARQANFDEVSI